jgi:hypothetical protein
VFLIFTFYRFLPKRLWMSFFFLQRNPFEYETLFQGIQVRKDFNFTEEAKGSNRHFTRAFNTTVTDRTLEIRLYWAGKGTTSIPRRGNYGPIISAISVCSGMLHVLFLPLIWNLQTSRSLIYTVEGHHWIHFYFNFMSFLGFFSSPHWWD